MITDEQRKAFEQWYMAQFGDKDMQTTESGNYFYVRHAAAWKSWQAAQQVKPLEFVAVSQNMKQARTTFGLYVISDFWDEFRLSLPGQQFYWRAYKTEAEAVAAANEDYRKRVLSCLVNGGE